MSEGCDSGLRSRHGISAGDRIERVECHGRDDGSCGVLDA